MNIFIDAHALRIKRTPRSGPWEVIVFYLLLWVRNDPAVAPYFSGYFEDRLQDTAIESAYDVGIREGLMSRSDAFIPDETHNFLGESAGGGSCLLQ